MTDPAPNCLVCNQDSDSVPLLTIQYRQQTLWICPQHLPILIHKPEQLAAQLPGFKPGPSAGH